ncbi:MAG: phosphatase PAP2 family protein [Candidatus Hodarchaeota archaeon]
MFEKFKESKVIILLFIVIIIWVILALIFGFTDLAISKSLVDETSPWGIFGKVFGEAPGYGLIAISLSVLIGSYENDIKKQKISAYIIIFIGLVLLLLGLIYINQDLINDGASITISLILFVIFTFNKDWEPFRKISMIIVILAILNPLLFIQITKVLTGRIRFEDLAPGFTDYTPWFLPPGPISSGRSFPSGHTGMSFMFLPLLILIKDQKWKKPVKIITTFMVLGWAIFVGLSRIVVGAHFASDVLFSAGMASVITILLYEKIYLK